MICEYALEPELVATWHTDPHYRHFIKNFGFDPDDGHATGRVVAQYPSNWKKRVWDAFRTNSGSSAGFFVKKERILVLLEQLGRIHARRSGDSYIWNNQCTWLKNAEEEDERHQFHAILACNPSDNPQVICGEDVLPGMDPLPLWSVPREEPVLRTAASMATHLEPMLRCATRILFIDPHFRPSEQKFRNPLKQFLKIICDGSRDVTLEYHTMHNDKKPAWNDFLDKCQKYLPSLIPHGFTLTVRRWEERDDNDHRDKRKKERDDNENEWDEWEERKLHNRYILTDIGGVGIPNGLDESDRYELDEKKRGTIDIHRLSFDIWKRRLEDYGYDPNQEPAFDLEEKVAIHGTA